MRSTVVGRSALCPPAPRDDDAAVPFQLTEFATGVVLMTGLVVAAALMGWVAAWIFLRATRPDAHEGRH